MIDWYQLRETGIAVSGPPIHALVAPISHEEYVEAARQHALAWPDDIQPSLTLGDLAYAILTMCRALRTCRTGEYASKREAARWRAQSSRSIPS